MNSRFYVVRSQRIYIHGRKEELHFYWSYTENYKKITPYNRSLRIKLSLNLSFLSLSVFCSSVISHSLSWIVFFYRLQCQLYTRWIQKRNPNWITRILLEFTAQYKLHLLAFSDGYNCFCRQEVELDYPPLHQLPCRWSESQPIQAVDQLVHCTMRYQSHQICLVFFWIL